MNKGGVSMEYIIKAITTEGMYVAINISPDEEETKIDAVLLSARSELFILGELKRAILKGNCQIELREETGSEGALRFWTTVDPKKLLLSLPIKDGYGSSRIDKIRGVINDDNCSIVITQHYSSISCQPEDNAMKIKVEQIS